MAEHKLDIFAVLNAVNARNNKFIDTLSDEELKALQPYVLMQWLVGTDDERQVVMMNEFANPAMFALAKHKKLLWQLLTVCSSGRRQRYQWTKLPGKQASSRPTASAVVERVYGYSSHDAAEALDILTVEDVVDMAFDLGMSGEEITKIKKEMKK